MNKNLEKLIDEMSDKFVKGFDFKTRGVSYRNHGFKEGAKAMHDLMIEDMKKLLETLERLTKVGPPSKPCSGSEWAIQALKDNCELADKVLQEYKSKCGEV